MAYTTVGAPPISGTADAAPWTLISLVDIALGRGIIKEIQAYIHANSNGCKFKVFRDDGTNFVWLFDSPTYNLVAGLNTYAVWLPVEKGDLIGLYSPNSGAGTHTDITAFAEDYGFAARAGDITTTTPKAEWNYYHYKQSLQGKIFSRTQPTII